MSRNNNEFIDGNTYANKYQAIDMIVGVAIVVGVVSLFSFCNQMSIFRAILAPF